MSDRVLRTAFLASFALVSGCGGSDRPAPAGSSGFPAGGAAGTSPSDSGTAGSSGSGGTTDAGSVPESGSGGDACREGDPGCSGVEDCFDGVENDGDALIDCFDDDCATACADPCASAPALPDPANVMGTTVGRAMQTVSSCTPSGGTSGPDMVYAFTAVHTGKLDVELQAADVLNVSVRTACMDAATDLGCGSSRLTVPVQAGQTVYIAVDSYEGTEGGPFELSASSRPVACGDLIRDDGEGCDDGNTSDGDGCDSTCHVEATEMESNDDFSGANAYVRPFFGEISPAGDIDVVSIALTGASSTLTAESQSFDDGACALELMDTVVEILDTDGTTVLASDDDGGAGLCSLASKSNLPAGTYYVGIRALSGSTPATFPYQLTVIATTP